MRTLRELLQANKNVTDFKINTVKEESSQLFFVHKNLETIRHSDTLTTKGTVYVEHDGKLGNNQFTVYASNTEEEIIAKIEASVKKALLIHNQIYELPKEEKESFSSTSNFEDYSLMELAKKTADAVYEADSYKDGALNAVEIFITKKTIHVENSRGIDKTEVVYDAMIEAIPTWNGIKESVELYEQYHFNEFDSKKITEEIDDKMKAVKARFEAVTSEKIGEVNILLRPQEIESIFREVAMNVNAGTAYQQANKLHVGEPLQTNPTKDRITLLVTPEIVGATSSRKFDSDGVSLKEVQLVDNGTVASYWGNNQFSQYMNIKPSGDVHCMILKGGDTPLAELMKKPYLECVSMSGIQADLMNDYLGGEIRLGYYFDGEKTIPVTGISISGSLTEVLNSIQMSKECRQDGDYFGPVKVCLSGMQVC